MKTTTFLTLLVLLLSTACNKSDPTVNGTTTSTGTTAPVGGGNDTTTPPPTDTTPPSSTDTNASWNDQFMKLINDHRVSIGLRALVSMPGLVSISEGHSQDMAQGKVPFGHLGFSSRCSQGYTVIGGGNWCGENVAMGQRTPQAAYTAWMNSPGHRANIEQPKATHTGFGYARSSSGTYYWTQIFIQKN